MLRSEVLWATCRWRWQSAATHQLTNVLSRADRNARLESVRGSKSKQRILEAAVFDSSVVRWRNAQPLSTTMSPR